MPQNQTYSKLSQTQIAKILREHIATKNTVFVFNTAVALETWTDFIVGMCGTDGWPKTLPMERFIAWDQFKAAAASVQEEGATSVPGLLRKLFARNLLSKVASGENIFERLINSKYAGSALAFTDWLSQILPSLGSWHKLMVKNGFIIEEKRPLDFARGDTFAENQDNKNEKLVPSHDTPENRDYQKLYNLYSEFLKKKNLFEPTWQELKFNTNDTRHYIIFYPELLDDYIEYKEILEAEEEKGKLELVRLEAHEQEIHANYYSSMRAELRMTALRILREHAAGTNWSDIAISVPEIENYLPYVERELQLYNIPYVVRAGTMLGKTGAGLIFRKMRDCYAGGFSFADVRSFVLDKKIPWKNPDAMQTLVRLGSELKCFFEYTDSSGKLVDPWTKNLPEAKKFQNETYFETQEFYKQLKKAVNAICGAKSFSSIKNNWIGADGFEEKFLIEKNAMAANANNLLSRCIKKLDELIALEKKYPEICDKNISHFEFFLNELETTQYTEQTQKAGVSVFPYKLSAMAAIPKQFVLNASQNAITVENPLLTFLPNAERRILLGEKFLQNDESQSYIAAYNKTGDCVFSVAEETLGGYAITYATLVTENKPRDFDEDLDSQDYLKQEKIFLQNGIFGADGNSTKYVVTSDYEGNVSPNEEASVTPNEVEGSFKKIPAKLKNGFDFYFNANGFDSGANTDTVQNFVQEKIREKVSSHNKENFPGKIFISQSAMKKFFTCPRKWIFSDILKLKEDTLDTDILEKYDAGTINHKILELYLSQAERLPTTDEQTKRLYNEEEIEEQIRGIIKTGEPFREIRTYNESSLAREILESQTEVFVRTIINFLRWFCQAKLYGDWKICATEKDLKLERGEDLVLDGKIDCVLSSGEDFSIIDFKNTESSIPSSKLFVPVPKKPKENVKYELSDFQMPMYFKLWEENLESDSTEKITGARFVPIKIKSLDKEIKEVITANKKNTTQTTREALVEKTLPLFDEYVQRMYDAIKSSDYSVRAVKKESCKGSSYPCDYRSICRAIYNTAGSSILSADSTEEN